MHIRTVTAEYDSWLASRVAVHQPDLDFKHKRMAEADDPFPFFRGTYYRWVSRWPEVCPHLVEAPRVLAVGDLHVENFGTWRDADARLCWGVNDFDEADDLPYTSDLVRLAASVRLAKTAEHLDVKTGAACAAILTGYRESLEVGGAAFVLEECHPQLRTVATASERDPAVFWKKLTKLLAHDAHAPPGPAKTALLRELPARKLAVEFRFRPKVGLGSLGRPRFVALAQWMGGWVAREAKAVVPCASQWALGNPDAESRAAELVGQAVRSPDPFYKPGPTWILRRLAPRCVRIELESLTNADDLERVLRAMGAETANVHAASRSAREAVVRDLANRPKDWLEDAARAMAKATIADWHAGRGG